MRKYHTLRLILGDQLNPKHSWFENQDDEVLYVMMELRQETDYVRHHIQKIEAFFTAMRRFKDIVASQGHHILYLPIESADNSGSLTEELNKVIRNQEIQRFEYQEPDEYRLDEQLKSFCSKLSIDHRLVSSEHFLTEREDVKELFEGRKQIVMEYFYRHLRQKNDILMVGELPAGGKWNYDSENRKKWKGNPQVPRWRNGKSKKQEFNLNDLNINHIGSEKRTIQFPKDRDESVEVLHHFCKVLLPHFGTYQDAMHTEQPFLFHSLLSFSLNTKMLNPKEVVVRAIEEWNHRPEEISLAQIEGFVRQIIGWREFMRGIYWMEMPTYKSTNFFNHKNPLPDFYWTGKTRMNCLKHAVNNSLDHAYAHHIQRLMVLGNFALLTGVHPDDVDFWFLGVYTDAIEWVQLPNTRGMSQYADGGLLATKPYISSGSYINKMSNYCSECAYNVKTRTDENACPFNSLYWNFLNTNKDKLSSNPRMSMMYRLLDKIPKEELRQLTQRAEAIIAAPDDL
ncbi:MAG TPA: cryptochrome/photolyase family protein [Flavobacteriales bacterium]|jgi:deoxyribodipyrimidine photolyase-related protein|nr:cryptochrome/photolyase family protein [Flavobacteriales bacterium]